MNKYNYGDRVRIDYAATRLHGQTGTVMSYDVDYQTYTVSMDETGDTRYFSEPRLLPHNEPEPDAEPEISEASRELLKLREMIREKRTATAAQLEQYTEGIDAVNRLLKFLGEVPVE